MSNRQGISYTRIKKSKKKTLSKTRKKCKNETKYNYF